MPCVPADVISNSCFSCPGAPLCSKSSHGEHQISHAADAQQTIERLSKAGCEVLGVKRSQEQIGSCDPWRIHGFLVLKLRDNRWTDQPEFIYKWIEHKAKELHQELEERRDKAQVPQEDWDSGLTVRDVEGRSILPPFSKADLLESSFPISVKFSSTKYMRVDWGAYGLIVQLAGSDDDFQSYQAAGRYVVSAFALTGAAATTVGISASVFHCQVGFFLIAPATAIAAGAWPLTIVTGLAVYLLVLEAPVAIAAACAEIAHYLEQYEDVKHSECALKKICRFIDMHCNKSYCISTWNCNHFAKALLVVLVSESATVECCLPNTAFKDEEGNFIAVQNLKLGSLVKAYDGAPTKVVFWKKHPPKKYALVELITAQGSITVSDNHRVVKAIDESGSSECVLADKLRKGDQVIVGNRKQTLDKARHFRDPKARELFEIGFMPDRPVETFMMPMFGMLTQGTPADQQFTDEACAIVSMMAQFSESDLLEAIPLDETYKD